MVGWGSLLACREPFGADRHDLVGDRIAAVELAPPGGPAGTAVAPRLAVVSDGALWSEQAPEVAWGFVDSGDDDAVVAFDPGSAAATGVSPSLVLPGGPSRVVGVVTWPSGEEERFFLDLVEDAAPVPSFVIGLEALPLTIAQVAAADLAVDARAALVGAPTDVLEVGGFGRLTVTPEAPVDGGARFMSVAGLGTWFELDPWVADWAAGDLVVDDDEIEASAPLGEERVVGGLVLVLGPDGATRWAARDWWVGTPTAGVWIRDRFLPSDVDVPLGASVVVLAPDPDASAGIRIAALDPGPAQDLPCAGAPGFDPVWLLEARCTVGDVVDVPVAVVVDP